MIFVIKLLKIVAKHALELLGQRALPDFHGL